MTSRCVTCAGSSSGSEKEGQRGGKRGLGWQQEMAGQGGRGVRESERPGTIGPGSSRRAVMTETDGWLAPIWGLWAQCTEGERQYGGMKSDRKPFRRGSPECFPSASVGSRSNGLNLS